MVRVEVESVDESVQRVEEGHPVAYVLGKLHSLTDVDLHLYTHSVHVHMEGNTGTV